MQCCLMTWELNTATVIMTVNEKNVLTNVSPSFNEFNLFVVYLTMLPVAQTV
jgi:hypothetical protein